MLVTKQLLAPGTYWSWDVLSQQAVPVEYTRDDLRHMCVQGREMIRSGLSIPVPLAHQKTGMPVEDQAAQSVKNNTGWVKNYFLDADGCLYGLLSIEDEETAKKLPTTVRFVSPQVHPEFTDGKGRRWERVVTHVALTTQPVWAGQKPFGSDGAVLMDLEAQTRHKAVLFSQYQGPALTLSLDSVIQFSWQAAQSRKGTTKAVGSAEHGGKTLYGKRAEAALRGRKKVQPKPTKARPQAPTDKPSRAGGPAEDARMAPPTVKPAAKPRLTVRQQTRQAAQQPEAENAQAKLLETLAQHPEQELTPGQRKSTNRALGQLVRVHGANVKHRIRNLAEGDLLALASGNGDQERLKARLQGYREMLRQLGHAPAKEATPTGIPADPQPQPKAKG